MNKQREIKFRSWDKKKKKMSDCEYLWFLDDQSINSIFRNYKYFFMQYTNLKDKNGVEIYEGDIVKLTDITYQVYYNSKLAKYGLKNPQGLSKFFGGGPEYNPEVVGNIYQNPELLEDEK